MSNELVDMLRGSRKSDRVAFMNFALEHSKSNEELLYCFFEGDDDKRYYGTRISIGAKKEYKPFTCGGRDNVKRVSKLIGGKKEYSDVVALYFIDKDYTEEKTVDKLYVTPYYSIENFYVADKSFKMILENEFNLNESENDFILAVKLFGMLRGVFHSNILFFNAWLSCQHDIRVEAGATTRLSIDGAVSNYFKSIVGSSLNRISDFADLNDKEKLEDVLFPNSPLVQEDVLVEKIKSFNGRDFKKDFRGKFEVRFMVSFLQKLKDEICKKESSIFEKRRKCTMVFDNANVISTLTQYAETPDCLAGFLDTI